MPRAEKPPRKSKIFSPLFSTKLIDDSYIARSGGGKKKLTAFNKFIVCLLVFFLGYRYRCHWCSGPCSKPKWHVSKKTNLICSIKTGSSLTCIFASGTECWLTLTTGSNLRLQTGKLLEKIPGRFKLLLTSYQEFFSGPKSLSMFKFVSKSFVT